MQKFKISIGKDGTTYRIRVSIGDSIKYVYPGSRDEIEVKKIALQIEQDILKNDFDYSLKRYKFMEEKTINLSVNQAYALWLDNTKKNAAPNTQKAYRGSGNLLKESRLGELPLKGFTRQKAYSFLAFCQEEKKLKPSSLLKRISDYKSCWDWLINSGYVADNPWLTIRKSFRNEKKTIDPFTKEEVGKILEGFTDEPEYYALVSFLFSTGCRTGEAFGLRWADLSDNMTSCTIGSQITRGQRRETKNKKTRTFKLPQSVTELLQKLPQSHERIFVTTRGQPIYPNVFLIKWRRVLGSQGIRYRRPYNCRHTFASHALQKLPLTAVAEIIGDDPNTVLKYYAAFVGSSLDVPQLW